MLTIVHTVLMRRCIPKGPTPFDPDTGLFLREPVWDDLPPWGDDDLSWDLAGRLKWELQRDYWYMKRHAAFYEHWEGGIGSGESRVRKTTPQAFHSKLDFGEGGE